MVEAVAESRLDDRIEAFGIAAFRWWFTGFR
jgi:hypothetical protein